MKNTLIALSILTSGISYGQEALKEFQTIEFKDLSCMIDIDRLDEPNGKATKYINETEMILIDNLETEKSKEIYIQYKNIQGDKLELHTYADGTIYQKGSVNEHSEINSTELSQIRAFMCSKLEEILKSKPESNLKKI